jgi:tRNA-dihydrouridine synthase 3
MHAFLTRRSHVLGPPAANARSTNTTPPAPAAAASPAGRRRHRSLPAAATADADPATSAPQQQQQQPPKQQHNFDADAERAAAVDAAREAFRATRLAAADKNRRLAEKLKGKLILAPLTRGGNLPFRQLCADFGCDAAMGEMIFARSLVGRNGSGKGASKAEKTRLRRASNEPLFGVQIATNVISEGAAAAKLARDAGASWLDLNVGCPIHEASRRGLGAVMLRKPTKLARLVSGMVAEAGDDLAVTVKIRTGPGEASVNAGFVAALLEAAGAAAVTIHGRTMEQR